MFEITVRYMKIYRERLFLLFVSFFIVALRTRDHSFASTFVSSFLVSRFILRCIRQSGYEMGKGRTMHF